ncbi:DUF3012 domain-containing protein [Rhodoferax sp. PAMC 29310]|uniref:DUF3012 domain-containing protein n=1 Tax=Rhodoferax sp. PAMC 29310 TaxID=2822760 RepID=UPI001B33D9CE|nr:DUF3012 domain-containing protein [Rhodoferax sp. PAMC 29310]
MNTLTKIGSFVVVTALLLLVSGCAAEVGSERWCTEMKGKQPADWTANQAVDYAKHCILK